MYFGTFLKNYYPDSFEIFSIFRGHRCHQNVKILRESDEGIFRRRVGRKIFDPLYLPYGGSWEPQIFTHVRALTCPHVGYIKSTLALGGREG